MSSQRRYGDPNMLGRQIASSPGPSIRSSTPDGSSATRNMKLKVLYTFDATATIKCLAKWPHSISVRTAFLDADTQIGVIDLKTCLQAVVTASPEIVAKLDQDFTIYVHDYSESDAPLVGQGMFSWAMTTSAAPGSDNPSNVVTGRVVKSGLSLFGGQAPDVLEVKMQLKPMPGIKQSDYLDSLTRYKDASRRSSHGTNSRSRSPMSDSGRSQHGIEHVQRLMSDAADRRPPLNRRDSFASVYTSIDNTGSRPGSPNPSVLSMPLPRHDSRPLSRGPLTSQQPLSARSLAQSTGTMDSGYMSQEERQDDGPQRKRAKVVQSDWRGKSQFGSKMDSLRVTASGAASVRVFQPAPQRAQPVFNLAQSETPRAPTPVPQLQARRPMQAQAPRRSALSRMASTMSDAASEYNSPYGGSELGTSYSDKPMGMNSPEDRYSVAEISPRDMASSPPIDNTHTMQLHTDAPSPQLPGQNDGVDLEMENIMGNLDGFLSEEGFNSAMMTGDLGFNFTDTFTDSDLPLLPPVPQTNAPQRPQMTAGNKPRTQKASENAQRSDSSMGDESGISQGSRKTNLIWNSPQTITEPELSKEPKRKWDKEKRRTQAEERQQKRLAAGLPLNFCANCGTTKTSGTWRRGYSKLHCGSMQHVRLGMRKGDVVATEIIERNEDESVKLFKIYKKSLLASDSGFTDITLCNPCGVWFRQGKGLRPSKLWEKDPQFRIEGWAPPSDDVDERPDVDAPRPAVPRKKKQTDSNSNESSIMSDASTGVVSLNTHAQAKLKEALKQTDPNKNPQSAGQESKDDNEEEHESSGSVIDITDTAPTNLETTTPANPDMDFDFLDLRTGGFESGQNDNDADADADADADGEHEDENDSATPAGYKTSPLRRSLFPSPKNKTPLSKSLGVISASNSRHTTSPLSKHTRDTSNKENELPTTRDVDDSIESNKLPPIATVTPTKKQASQTVLPKTPLLTRSTTRPGPSPHDIFSSPAARAFLLDAQSQLRTPSRTRNANTPSRTPKSAANANAHANADMTPFSKQWHALMSEPITMESPTRPRSAGAGTVAFEGMDVPSMTHSDSFNTTTPGRTRSLSLGLGDDIFARLADGAAAFGSSPPGQGWMDASKADELFSEWIEFGVATSPLKRMVGVGGVNE